LPNLLKQVVDGPDSRARDDGAPPKEYLAESIIKFYSAVAVPGYMGKEGKAAMGEYDHFLSVQELIDVVAVF
jgi:hypothetical protein